MRRTLLCALYLLVSAVSVQSLASEPDLKSVSGVKSVVIDGKLNDWKDVKPVGDWNQRDKIVWGGERFNAPTDLGGQAWMGWDEKNLYVAASVVDDELRQFETGENIYRGDHVIVLLDMDRDGDRDVLEFNGDDFQIGLSPGSLKTGGDLLSNRPPEAWVWKPQYVQNSGISVAAQRTEKGYTLEAAIPWTFLRVDPANGLHFAADICPSDTDGNEAKQQTLASLRPGQWTIGTTDRLIDMQLVGGETIGIKRKSLPTITIQQAEVQLDPQQERAFEINVPELAADQMPLIQLQARCVFDTLAGASPGLVVLVNGHPLDDSCEPDKPKSVTFARGDSQSLYGAESWTIFYSPDYKAIHADTNSGYYIPPGTTDVYKHAFGAKSFIQKGKNIVTVRYAAASGATAKMAIANLRLKWATASSLKRDGAVAARPPVIGTAIARLAPAKSVALKDTGAIQFVANGKSYVIQSQYSQPGGKWLTTEEMTSSGWKSQQRVGDLQMNSTANSLRVSRQIKVLDECIEVHDTLTNLTMNDLPVMVRHTIQLAASQVSAVTLNGREMPLKRGISANAYNPTLLVKDTSGGAVGLMAIDDVLRVHHQLFYLNETAGLADSSLVLPPKAEYEQVWQIYAVPSGSYWDMINAARRYFDANFRIDGPQVFLDPRRTSKLHYGMSSESMREWLTARNARIASIMMVDTASGAYLHGLKYKLDGDQLADLTKIADAIKSGSPDVRLAHYFHCFLTGPGTTSDCDPADAMLEPDGSQSCYNGDKAWPIYLPTLSNKYGKAMFAQVQEMVDKLHLTALYWDESQYCDHQYHYGEPWDGFSGDIDSTTHELKRKKSHVTLISAPFRNQMLKWLGEHGIEATLNSPPMTTSEMKFKVRHFTESGSITNLFDTHLFTPIGLSDHLSERSHEDTIRLQREFLDRGCLYDYYSPPIAVKNPGLVRWMYPIKITAIGPGFVIGEDRILTSAAGRFNFGSSRLPQVDVHVINGSGDEIKPQFAKVEKDGQECIELKLGNGEMAAIVAKK